MRKTLYIDIDSTIWPAEDIYARNAMQLHGIEYDPKDQYNEAFFKEVFGPEWFKVFTFDPAEVQDRELYPGVALGLYELAGMGFNIHFLSHNPKPQQMYLPIDLWLGQYIHIPYSLTIFGARNCKVKFMGDDPNAWGIIEDKPSTLAKAKKAGYGVLARRQPWNIDTIVEYDIMSFDSWFVVADIVRESEVVCR